jgi:hypothetical protein
VTTRAAISPSPQGEISSVLQITVENHSPRTFFLSSVGLKLRDGKGLWFKRDALSGLPNAPQEIEPGDSYSFYVSRETFAQIEVDRIVCAEAYDKIGRTFNSDPEETKKSLESLTKEVPGRSVETG